MAKIIYHIEDNIYEVVYPENTDTPEIKRLIVELDEILDRIQGKIRILSNLKNIHTTPSKEALKLITSTLRNNYCNVEKSCICNLNPQIEKTITGLLVIANRLDIRTIDNRSEALRWLKQEKLELNIDDIEIAINWLQKNEEHINETNLIPKLHKDTSHILIIEDNISILKIYKRICEKKFNAKVFTAEKGSDGIDILDSYTIDLILCDLMLPDMSGFEVIKKIRNITRHRETPIIIISAIADKLDVIKGISYGANDYIVKPASSKLLNERISNYIET